MINTIELTKIYSTDEVQTKALSAINLTIQKGEFVAIMGPSGCGKSTLLNILGLLDEADGGAYQLLNQEMLATSEKIKANFRKKHIGFIFQNFNLIDELTVFENVELPLIYNKVPATERKHRVEEILDKIQISHRKNHYPQQLSGGQQQRVAVARALVTKPELIFADEPTGNLDSTNGNEVMNLLADLHREGATLVMVTHSAYDASYASRIIHMKDGAIFNQELIDRSKDKFEKINEDEVELTIKN